MKYLDRLLNRFGYYNIRQYKVENVRIEDVTSLLGEYAGNKTFRSFLHNLSRKDIELYFTATTDEDRWKIRGANERINYLIALAKKGNDRR